jgi:hypothetical protein
MGHNRRPFEPLRDGPILTIGQVHSSRGSLWAFCRNCASSTDVDTWKLIQRVGTRDMTLVEAAKRFRCRRCLNATAILIPGDGFAHSG